MMMKEDLMVVLNKAMENFNGVRLYLEERDEDFGVITRWELYPKAKGIDVWSCHKSIEAGSVWGLDDYRGTIEWEDVPKEYRKELDAE